MENTIQDNPLKTRSDVEAAAIKLIEPLLSHMSPGHARLHLGETGAVYPDSIAQMEAFARPLWAIIPLLRGKCSRIWPIWDTWRQGIIHGVDREHPEYWGEVGSYDQRLVEMAVFGYGMMLAPNEFFFDLPKKTQKQLHTWLDQINHREMPQNNWYYFRILVNAGFQKCGLPYHAEQIANDFAVIDAHYQGDGWYYDTPSRWDYYTMWAFQFYGLVYATAMKDLDPDRSHRLLTRAIQMGPDFAHWFDRTGEALPYGRSLTYRFAQSAYFSALALAEGSTDQMAYGVMKHLLLANMRKWFSRPIFDREGILTIGYAYPDLLMAEGYNAPGSPYWALKSFACLMLPEDHPFWQEAEMCFQAQQLHCQTNSQMLIARSADGDHVMAYPAGNTAIGLEHGEAKHEKFVYSTIFGFSVPKTLYGLSGGAFDNVLALSEDQQSYHPRYRNRMTEISPDRIGSTWEPLPGVRVETTIYPHLEWHVRVHHIYTDRKLYAAEGGFAIRREAETDERYDSQEHMTAQRTVTATAASVVAPYGISGIRALRGYHRAEIIEAQPNTNLMSPRTFIPTLHAVLEAGESVLVSMVYGTMAGTEEDWMKPPVELMYIAEKSL